MTTDSLFFGDIVLLSFPFTDFTKSKKRPGVILRDTHDGDVIVLRVTSKEKETEFDLEIDDWEVVGLKFPSIIRIHKIATLDQSLVVDKIGKLTVGDKNRLLQHLQTLFFN